MTDDTRPGGMRGRLRPGAGARSGKAGDPNVLSGAATPNRLSDQTTPPKPIPVSTGGQGSTPRPTANTTWTPTAPRPVATPVDDDPTAPRRRLPTFGTVIFLGFLALTGFRLINEFAQDFGPSGPTSAPATVRPPGPITFGTGMSDSCEVSGAASSFTAGAEVWWLAQLATRQSRTSIVVAKVLRNDSVVSRVEWPPDGSATWIIMCDGPVPEDVAGSYRIEVWNEQESVLLAAGEYTVR